MSYTHPETHVFTVQIYNTVTSSVEVYIATIIALCQKTLSCLSCFVFSNCNYYSFLLFFTHIGKQFSLAPSWILSIL